MGDIPPRFWLVLAAVLILLVFEVRAWMRMHHRELMEKFDKEEKS